MKLGLFLSAHQPPGRDTAALLDELYEQAELADELGFHSIFLGHHYLANSAFLQPLPLLGDLAARTERVRLGLGVYLLSLHNPVAVAEELATLDALSGGRLVAGFGSGYRKKEFEAFGIPFENRFRRLDEAVRVMRALWAGEEVTVEGEFGKLERARLHLPPSQPGGPPIWLGAFGDRGIRRVAEHDAVWLAPPDGDEETIGDRLTLLRAELEQRGCSLEREYPIAREGFVARDRGTALATAREHILRQYTNYRNWEQAQQIEADSFLAEQAVIGSPEDAIERLLGLERRLGVTQVLMRMQWDGMDHADSLAAIRTVGEDVIPHL